MTLIWSNLSKIDTQIGHRLYHIIHIIWTISYGGDTCSCEGQLKRTRSWKVLSWKVWSWKVSVKLERANRSWKEPSEVGKNRLKLESSGWSLNEPLNSEIDLWSWKESMKLERLNEVGKLLWNLKKEVGKLNWYKNGDACF